MATLYASDSHFGLHLPDAERIAATMSRVIREEHFGASDVLFAGDLVASWRQQNDTPEWRDNLQTDGGQWVEALRERCATVLAGNCERTEEMELLQMPRMPYVHYDEKTGVLATHGHLVEPKSPLDLIRMLPVSIVQRIPAVRNAIQSVLGLHHADTFDVKGSVERLSQALRNDRALESILRELDHTRHEKSADTYMTIAKRADYVPLLRNLFDRMVHAGLNGYYIRTLIMCVRSLVQSKELPAPRTILYGHTHRPFVRRTESLRKRLGLGKGWLPEWIVNDGTMVPLTKKNGGTNESHFVIVRDNGIPELYCSTDAPRIELVNIGGKDVT